MTSRAPPPFEERPMPKRIAAGPRRSPFAAGAVRLPGLVLGLVLALAAAAPVAAECYADYKAKKDDPLQLHYGVARVSDANCSKRGAAGELAPRLAGNGWKLLNVLSTFGPEGLAERKGSAGAYFLRF